MSFWSYATHGMTDGHAPWTSPDENSNPSMLVKPHHPLHKRLKYLAITLSVAFLGLVSFGIYTGQPVWFLKWFFGLVADD